MIGGSAGAVEATQAIAAQLPRDLPAAVFVVLHIPATAHSILPQILARAGAMPAAHASNGETIECGRILVAPPDRHLILSRDRVQLSAGPREHGHRPSADTLFRSAANNHGRRVIGVVLTGMLGDGAAGLARIVAGGGVGIVQDPASAAFSSLPNLAVRAANPQHVVPLHAIAPLIAELAGSEVMSMSPDTPPISPTQLPETGESSRLGDPAIGDDVPGSPSGFSCPDCGGVLWERDDVGAMELVCRIGHLYSLESLVEAKNSALEGALWAAVRALEEQSSLRRRIAAGQLDLGSASSALTARADDADDQARLLRGILERRLPG